jgi:hypothetical protein
MCQFVLFMVSFDIDPQIQTVKVRDAELVPVAVKYKVGIVETKGPDRIGNRAASLVYKVHGEAKASGELVVRDQTQIVGLVEI